MATRAVKHPTRAKSVTPLKTKKPAPPSRHSTQWFEQQIIALLRIHAGAAGVPLINVVDNINDTEADYVGLDPEGVDVLLQAHLSRERATKRQRILTAAKKLSKEELDVLGISQEARGIIDSHDEEDEEDDYDD